MEPEKLRVPFLYKRKMKKRGDRSPGSLSESSEYGLFISRSSASAGPRRPCRGGLSPRGRPRGDPIWIKMLGGSKFRLRQDFCQGQKCLLTRPATEKFPRLWAGGIEFQLAEVALQQTLESLAVAGLVAGHLVSHFAPLVTSILAIPID